MRLRNLIAEGSFWLSRWRLKSPAITRFPECVARTSRKDANSARKVEKDDLFLEEGGGR